MVRIYGEKPISICVIHGGPGAHGSMAPVARELSGYPGVLEPMQSGHSIEALMKELRSQVSEHAVAPVTLIGHSWGAWISYLFAAQFPGTVNKIILVAGGPFTSKYARTLDKTRLSRLSSAEQKEFQELIRQLALPSPDEVKHMSRLEEILLKSDSFSPSYADMNKHDSLPPDPRSFRALWHEGEQLRRSGALLSYGSSIECPVIGIHGDYDPHPAAGVRKPLEKVLRDFRFHLLERCGHYPWFEEHARDRFFTLIRNELEE